MEFKQYVCCCNELDPAMNQKKYVYIYIYIIRVSLVNMSVFGYDMNDVERGVYIVYYILGEVPH